MSRTTEPIGVTIARGCRQARVDHNRAGGKPFAVFKHTFYLGRWYFDGWQECDTVQAAVEYRDRWLGGGSDDGAATGASAP